MRCTVEQQHDHAGPRGPGQRVGDLGKIAIGVIGLHEDHGTT
jgi:hypothetical protein